LHNEVYEILQPKHQGCVIRGYHDLSVIPEPTQEDIQRSLADLVTDLVGAWERNYPAPIDPADARTNAILYWLRLFVWDRTGEYVLAKYEALAAFGKLDEAAPMFSRLNPISAYLEQRQDTPGPVEALCHTAAIPSTRSSPNMSSKPFAKSSTRPAILSQCSHRERSRSYSLHMQFP
jgi:hypothetical protein